jgi:hypothetical protein
MSAAAALSAGAWIAACGSTGGQGTSGGIGGAGGAGAGGSGTSSSGSASSSGGFNLDASTHDSSYTQDGDACGSSPIQTMMTPGTIVVVFDQSDSMNQAFSSGDGGPSGAKYKVAEDSLVAALMPSQANLNIGAIFFPTKNTGTSTCTAAVAPITNSPQIPVEPGGMFLTDFQGHFSAAGWSLILGTPTGDALTRADTALAGPAPASGKRAVIILTDGAPTCEGDAGVNSILGPVQDMYSRGIQTYAIGLPGSATAANLLNQIASAGGTGQYISPADQASLQTALAQIASQTIDMCTVTLNPPPPDPSKVYLIVTDPQHPNGEVIPEVSDAGSDGWVIGPNGDTATLTGAVCTNAKNGAYSTINFVYGCPTLPQ